MKLSTPFLLLMSSLMFAAGNEHQVGLPCELHGVGCSSSDVALSDARGEKGKMIRGKSIKATKTNSKSPPPNIIVFMVDDLGFNQVGFHANKVGNMEVHTPKIDEHANRGIIMNRAYMMPWCGPSRASFVTGTTYSYNQALNNELFSFDDSIGFANGIPAGISSVAEGLKNANPMYTATYAGKWGIGGSAWRNTPLGMGFDESRVFWGDSIEPCSGKVTQTATPGTEGGIMRTVQGYFEQSRKPSKSQLCDIIQSVPKETLSDEEKVIACSTTTRTPAKLIDSDLLDYATGIIKSHDYESGPLFHFHATQIAHLPMRYPKYYDNVPIPENPVPEYFKDGEVKPTPDNDIVRMKTNNLLRFMDDLFGDLMESIKEAGQWDNTIVLFTSDNGGAVFPNGQANQNYPLRGAKRSNFDGGVRVSQFLTGGWVEKNTPSGTGKASDTYMFSLDWPATFVEMAGGNSETDLFSPAFGETFDTKGPAYGKEMWQYIKNSVQPETKEGNLKIQLPRRVLYTPIMSFQVYEEATHKFFWTEGAKSLYINKWEPIWPTGTDYMTDFSAISVNPCRISRNNPMKCCLLDIENDPEEDYPILDANCDALRKQNEDEWSSGVSKLCSLQPQFAPLCITTKSANHPEPLEQGADQGTYSLWTWQKGAGPYLNATGYPITNYGKYHGTVLPPGELSPKCACQVIDDGIGQDEVDAFFSNVQTPSMCIRKRDYPDTNCTGMSCAIDCSGGFTQLPQSGWLDAYEAQGLDKELYADIAHIEHTHGTNSIPIPKLYEALQSLVWREGFTEWPDMLAFPFITFEDYCVALDVTIVPPSKTATTPWNFAVGGTATRVSGTDLSSAYNSTHCWCEALQNPLLNDYMEFARDGSWVKMKNYTTNEIETLYPWPLEKCDAECTATTSGGGVGTAYVSANGRKGIAV